MSNNKTLVDVANTQPGAYAQGPFQGTISKTQARQSKAGKAFYKAVITDGLTTIDVTSFSRDLSQFEGQLVTINGMGIKRGEDFRGMAQISLSDKTTVTSYGVGSVPIELTGAPSVTSAKTDRNSYSNKNEGIVIGACLNKAVDICIAVEKTDEDSIWMVASRLLRVSNRLSKGDLHSTSEVPVPTLDEEQPY
jgi:hypothetical protein